MTTNEAGRRGRVNHCLVLVVVKISIISSDGLLITVNYPFIGIAEHALVYLGDDLHSFFCL